MGILNGNHAEELFTIVNFSNGPIGVSNMEPAHAKNNNDIIVTSSRSDSGPIQTRDTDSTIGVIDPNIPRPHNKTNMPDDTCNTSNIGKVLNNNPMHNDMNNTSQGTIGNVELDMEIMDETQQQ